MNIELVDWIKSGLEKKNWTQRKLCEVSGINKSTLTRILKSESKTPNVSTIRLFETALESRFLPEIDEQTQTESKEELLDRLLHIQHFSCALCERALDKAAARLIQVPNTANEFIVNCSRCSQYENSAKIASDDDKLKALLSTHTQADVAKLVGVKDSTIHRVKVNEDAHFSEKASKNIHIAYRREQFVLARSNLHRLKIFDWWGGCALTGIQDHKLIEIANLLPSLLKGTGGGQLTIYSSLPLCFMHHRLLDIGYISFDENENLLISPLLNDSDIYTLNLNTKMKIRKEISPRLKECIAYHRELIFKAE